ncbi:hypothetical protein RYH80_16005 [Halobaculum sp. MBLA0147]|uniref:hypothetical protein n=1 Tax=Halobaculum sp. MBLA0147 TaxID=3079934 RepID=UPI003526AAD6
MQLGRRRLLAGLVVGTAALGGAGTGAVVRDREAVGNAVDASQLDVRVAYWTDTDAGVDPATPDGVVDGPTVTLPAVELTDASTTATVVLEVGPVDDYDRPVALSLRATAPQTQVSETVRVRVSAATADGTPTQTLASDTLSGFAQSTPLALDDGSGSNGCVVGPVTLAFEFDPAGFVGEAAVDLTLTVDAQQCVPPTAALSEPRWSR